MDDAGGTSSVMRVKLAYQDNTQVFFFPSLS